MNQNIRKKLAKMKAMEAQVRKITILDDLEKLNKKEKESLSMCEDLLVNYDDAKLLLDFNETKEQPKYGELLDIFPVIFVDREVSFIALKDLLLGEIPESENFRLRGFLHPIYAEKNTIFMKIIDPSHIIGLGKDRSFFLNMLLKNFIKLAELEVADIDDKYAILSGTILRADMDDIIKKQKNYFGLGDIYISALQLSENKDDVTKKCLEILEGERSKNSFDISLTKTESDIENPFINSLIDSTSPLSKNARKASKARAEKRRNLRNFSIIFYIEFKARYKTANNTALIISNKQEDLCNLFCEPTLSDSRSQKTIQEWISKHISGNNELPKMDAELYKKAKSIFIN